MRLIDVRAQVKGGTAGPVRSPHNHVSTLGQLRAVVKGYERFVRFLAWFVLFGLFEVEYPEIEEDCLPRHRFMSAYEQKVEAPEPNFQYLLFAAEPYETVAFKIPNMEAGERRIQSFVGPVSQFALQRVANFTR